MADNVTANSGSGGATFATDDIGGVHYPISKPAYGALDSVTIVAKSTGNGLPIEAIPGTTAGLTPSKTISAASTNATSVKGSAGKLYLVHVSNTNASARYLKLYDKATSPTVGSDTPVQTLLVPPNSSGVALGSSVGLGFSSGIAFALTTGVTDADTGAVAANELVVNLWYA